jgi:hypothetical protein
MFGQTTFPQMLLVFWGLCMSNAQSIFQVVITHKNADAVLSLWPQHFEFWRKPVAGHSQGHFDEH